jgi:hypothetical protein
VSRSSEIYEFRPRYSRVTPFAQVGYIVNERTAAAHWFYVAKDGNNRWVATRGSLSTRPQKTRSSACLLMSSMLDRAVSA